jgi:hypothetical protein
MYRVFPSLEIVYVEGIADLPSIFHKSCGSIENAVEVNAINNKTTENKNDFFINPPNFFIIQNFIIHNRQVKVHFVTLIFLKM